MIWKVTTNNNSSNTFDVLSDPELILRAVKMGVNIPDTDFASIDILRELKKSRANILKINTENARDDNKSGNLFLINAKGDKTPLNMEWGMSAILNLILMNILW